MIYADWYKTDNEDTSEKFGTTGFFISPNSYITRVCSGAVGAAGAMAAKVANDRRTVGTQLDDQNADAAVSYQWSKSDALKEQANLQVDVYNGVALLTGQAPNQGLVDVAVRRAQEVSYIKKIHNQIRIGEAIGAGTQATCG